MVSLYLDCYSGISCNMLLGAFMQAGVKPEYLMHQLARISNVHSYRLNTESIYKNGIYVTQASIQHQEPWDDMRTLHDVFELIQHSDLENDVKQNAIRIIHSAVQFDPDHLMDSRFLQAIGGMNSVIDLVGCCICMKKLQVDRLYLLRLNVGVRFDYQTPSILPLTDSVTHDLLSQIPFEYLLNEKHGLITSLGVAFLNYFLTKRIFYTDFTIDSNSIYYGTDNVSSDKVNVLRAYLKSDSVNLNALAQVVIETTTDIEKSNQNSELYEALVKNGALDVHCASVAVKKQKLQMILNVISYRDHLKSISRTVFEFAKSMDVCIQKIDLVPSTGSVSLPDHGHVLHDNQWVDYGANDSVDPYRSVPDDEPAEPVAVNF